MILDLEWFDLDSPFVLSLDSSHHFFNDLICYIAYMGTSLHTNKKTGELMILLQAFAVLLEVFDIKGLYFLS